MQVTLLIFREKAIDFGERIAYIMIAQVEVCQRLWWHKRFFFFNTKTLAGEGDT